MRKNLNLRTKICLIVSGACAFCAIVALSVSFHYKQVELRAGLIEKSKTIHSRILAACKYVAQQEGLPSIIEKYAAKYSSPDQLTEKDRQDILKQVPIYAGMRIGADGSEKERYVFRIFSDSPRNKDNQATEEEMKIFNYFAKNPDTDEWVENNEERVTVYRAVRIKENQGCLKCHGDPQTSPWKNGKDILGYPMENWSDGKLHGVFAISNNLATVKAAALAAGGISSDHMMMLFIFLAAAAAVAIANYVIRKPLSTVRHVGHQLTTDSSEVGVAVSQLFSVAKELAETSTNQAEASQQTATAVEEIAQMVRKSASEANESKQLSSESTRTAEKGQEIIMEMTQAISEIKEKNTEIMNAVSSGNDQIGQFVKVIHAIDEKTKVINEIVFQTKLLSFNASVEAARAGEHGKGFSVVAEEVGNLARMSGNAAKEITQLLVESTDRVEKMVEETTQRVNGIMASAEEKVGRGVAIAHECEGILKKTVESSNVVSSRVSSIALANEEQARGVEEISRAVHQIDSGTKVGTRVSQQCSVSAEELARKVESLSTAASDLRLVVEGKGNPSTSHRDQENNINAEEWEETSEEPIQKRTA